MRTIIQAFIDGGCKNPQGFPAIYPQSVNLVNGGAVFMIRGENEDWLVATNRLGFHGENMGGWLLCPLNHENAQRLRTLFPFTAPSRVLGKQRSLGMGDRLGIATPGHIRAFLQYDAYPVFAQQSMRELVFTERTYEEVLDCATFAVFRENFRRPFGADGDHLKTGSEIEYALNCGYTMITLDCSEHIKNEAAVMSADEVEAAYVPNAALEERYLGKSFKVGNHIISFDRNTFKRACLIYNDAIAFAAEIYHKYFDGENAKADFEISIDETSGTTTPEQHFFFADRLNTMGVKPCTLAPRFCGEFQKAVDYIGDISEFENELAVHVAIAEHFGYKISVHSGSDKFSIYDIIGKQTKGHFHLKTAGTSWLEALSVIAEKDPALYREIYAFAISILPDAKKHYHISTDLTKLPEIDSMKDEELAHTLKGNETRQLLHITFGYILSEKGSDGKYLFRKRLYADWFAYADEYEKRLEKHIGRHLAMLYQGFDNKSDY